MTAVRGDVRDVDLGALGPLDAVVHAASPANPASFAADPVGVVEANAFGAARLLDAVRGSGGWFGLVSTMEVYGRVRVDGTDEAVLDESAVGTVDPLDLRSAYPESKRLAETLCVAHAAQHGTRSDIARLSHTYGPGMPLTDSRVQAEFLRLALAGEPITLQSDGSMGRTYTYAADAAAAVVWLLVTARHRTGAEAFNVADEDSRTTIRGLAEAVLRAAGRDAADLTVAGAPADTAAVEPHGRRDVPRLHQAALARLVGPLAPSGRARAHRRVPPGGRAMTESAGLRTLDVVVVAETPDPDLVERTVRALAVNEIVLRRIGRVHVVGADVPPAAAHLPFPVLPLELADGRLPAELAKPQAGHWVVLRAGDELQERPMRALFDAVRRRTAPALFGLRPDGRDHGAEYLLYARWASAPGSRWSATRTRCGSARPD